MRLSPPRSFVLSGALAAIGALLVALSFSFSSREHIRRRFMPGELGEEPGSAVAKATANAYLTRAFSGIERIDDGAWARENGLGPALSFSHHLAAIFPPELAREHPEFFPWENGRRVLPPKGSGYWNPDLGRADVAEWAAVAARRHFDQNPAALSFAIGINDGLLFGESPETLARVWPPRWFRGRPDYSNLVFSFANRVAESVAATHPDRFLGALAYYWCEQVPEFPVHRQVLPFLTADRSQGYDPAFLAENRALQARWAKAGPARLGLYDYVYGYGFLVPRIHPHLLADNLRVARRLGFTDYYAEVGPNWGIDGPMPWVLAQLLLDPESSVDGLLGEYYTRYFQEAAAPMRRFFERCEVQWMEQSGPSYWLKHYRNQSQATLFPSAVCADLRRELDTAQRLARSARVRARVTFVAEAFTVSERLVDLQQSRAALAQWLAAGPRPPAFGLVCLETYLGARRAFIETAKDVTRRLPLAFGPINYDDFLRHDPAYAAAATLWAVGGDVGARLAAEPEVAVQAGRQWAAAQAISAGVELVPDGSLEGPARAPLMAAGLAVGIGLPEGWISSVEATERHRGEVTAGAAHTGGRGLRIAGATNTTVFRWLPAHHGAFYAAQIAVRGHVSVSNAVTLTLGWLDAQHRPLGSVKVDQLPDGSWPEWSTLAQGVRAPVGTAWVGLGLRVQNQMPGDWAEFDDFSLREFPAGSR